MKNDEIENLKTSVVTAETKEKKANFLSKLSWELLRLSRYDESMHYVTEAIKLSREEGMIVHLANSLNTFGLVLQKQAQYIKSLEHFQQALDLFESVKDTKSTAPILGNIGMVYLNLGDCSKSLDYYSRALSIHEHFNNLDGMAICKGMIGSVYKELRDFTKSLECYEKSKILFESATTPDIPSIATCYCNIGAIYQELSMFWKAIEYHQKALDIYESYDYLEGIARQIGNIGITYSEPNFEGYNPSLSESYLLKAVTLNEKLGRKQTLCSNHQYLGELYEQENDYGRSIKHFKRQFEIYREIQSEEVKKQADKYGWERKIAEMEKEKAITQITVEAEKKLLALKIEHQTKEVESTIRELVGKNRLLSEIRTNVQRLERYTKGEGIDILEKLSERLDRNITSLDEKSEIETQWREVHAEFMENLHHQHLDLTTMELKICVLLRMKLTTSNICSVLFLSKRTVESHRLSIRKKLGLSKQDDLNVVLSKL